MKFVNKVVKIHINNESFIIRITEKLCECSYVEKERKSPKGIDFEERFSNEDSIFSPSFLLQ